MSQIDPNTPEDADKGPAPATPSMLPAEQRLPPTQSLDGGSGPGGANPGGWPVPPTTEPPTLTPPHFAPPQFTPNASGEADPATPQMPPGYPPPGYPPVGYPPLGYPPVGYPPAGTYPPPDSYSQPQWYPPAPGFAGGMPSNVAWAIPLAPIGPMPGVVWGSIGSRLGALIVDAVVMVAAFVAASMVATGLGTTRDVNNDVQFSAAGMAVLWIWVGFFLIYHPMFWWRLGRTPGQMAFHLRVVREADGRRLHFGETLMRYVVWFGCMVTVVLAVLAAIFAASEPKKRAWHDEGAGSVVIKPIY